LFGTAVAIDGDTLVIGAPAAETVSVFGRNIDPEGPVWIHQGALNASISDAGDYFGVAVAIDGATVVVGAPYEDSNGSDPANNSALRAGAAYVFVRTGTPAAPNWSQQHYLKAANAGGGDEFGYTVAMAGPTVVIGAWGESSDGSSPDDNSATTAGAVYVFARTGITWTQQTYRKAANPDAHDNFGDPVAIDGATLVVGAYGEDSNGSSPADNSAPQAGAAYVIELQGVPTYLPLLMRH
jgi:trimeric autotransporter adhesin